MKYLFFLLLITLPVSDLMAQDTLHRKPNKVNELGLFGQSELHGNNEYVGLAGVQYKHWLNEHLGYRIIAAYGQYNNSNNGSISVHIPDTVFTTREHMNINLPIIGCGLEAQRHFFKKIYLFAAMELKGGYGNGTADTIITRTYGSGNPDQVSYINGGSHNASLFYLGLTASVGAKCQFNRIAIGLELLPVQISFTKLSYTGAQNSSITNMDLGNLSQRIFLHYRF